jgi:hypothetical protein
MLPLPPTCHIGRTLGTAKRTPVSVTSYTGGRRLAASRFNQAGQVSSNGDTGSPLEARTRADFFVCFYSLVHITLRCKYCISPLACNTLGYTRNPRCAKFIKKKSCPEEREPEPRAPLCLLLVYSFVSSFYSSLGAGNGDIFL